MVFRRLHAPAFAVALAGLGLAAAPISAEDFPTRPVTMIVPSTAGGGTDINARIFGERLSRELGQPFIIDDRPGAGSVVGTVAVANATPDGYTLLAGLNADMAVNPSLFAKLAYDPIRDFVPVVDVLEISVRGRGEQKFSGNLGQGTHRARQIAKPGAINYASAGNGTGQHLSMELFKLMAGINLAHVPYRGAAPAYADVISGQVPVIFDNMASAIGPDSGRHRAGACGERHATIAAVARCAHSR
jgi:tripartite-type tricarboxylate transporter receptor subunit TctC